MMEFTAIATLFMVFWSIQDSSGQIVKPGQCPKVKVKQDVDINLFLGTWYQYATFGTRLFQGEGRCVTARYTYNSTTGKVDVLNSQIPKRGAFPSMSSIKGTLEFADSKSNEARFVVTFPAPVIQSIKAPYWVLDTDYESFAVVYSCVDAVLAHALSGWILTRMQDVGHSPQDKTRIEAAVAGALAEAGLHRSLFQITDQTQCSVRMDPDEDAGRGPLPPGQDQDRGRSSRGVGRGRATQVPVSNHGPDTVQCQDGS